MFFNPLDTTARSMHGRSSWATCLFVALMAIAATGHAQSRFEEDFDEQGKPWQEIAMQLPSAPSPENSLLFYVSPTATQTFAIDAKSLSVGSDGVVRYTLLATSASGAKSISYEGIRCDLLQKKLYAFGRQDGTWSRSRRDQWEPISGNAANRQHAALVGDYLCMDGTVAGKASEMIERIRTKHALSPYIK
jgi:hypothetical protein